MKNIVIIEDNFEHFQIIRKLISSNEIDVYPKNINSGQDLCDFLTSVRAFIDTTDATERAKRINEFFDDMNLKQNGNNIQVSLYIVDYQLLADNNYINGLRFCEYLSDIREGKVPAIILTIIDLNDVNVINKRHEFINRFPESKIEFYRKVQDQTRKKIKNWDENGKSIDEIVNNCSQLSSNLKSTINRLCQLTSFQSNTPYEAIN
jgi:CheY-like chemotaxis protein